jgi:hypothetical protein
VQEASQQHLGVGSADQPARIRPYCAPCRQPAGQGERLSGPHSNGAQERR